MGARALGGVLARDPAVQLGLSVGLETGGAALHLRAPLELRLWDLPPTDAEKGVCVVVRCAPLRVRPAALDFRGLAPFIDEARLTGPGDLATLSVRATTLRSVSGGALLDGVISGVEADRPRPAVIANATLPSGAAAIEFSGVDVLSPWELSAAMVTLRPMAFVLDDIGGWQRFLSRFTISAGIAGEMFGARGPNDVDDTGRIRIASAPGVGQGVLLAAWPLLEDDAPVTLSPRVVLSTMAGLPAAMAPMGVGAGARGGLELALKLPVVAVILESDVFVETRSHRFGLFGPLWVVDRVQHVGQEGTTLSAVQVPAPGGVGGRVAASVAVDAHVRLGGRALWSSSALAREAEAFVRAELFGAQIAGRVLWRFPTTRSAGAFAAERVVFAVDSAVVLIGPLAATVEARLAPRYAASGYRTDLDVLIGLSVDSVFVPTF